MGNGWSLENQAKLLNSFVSKLPYVVFYNLKPITKSPRKKKPKITKTQEITSTRCFSHGDAKTDFAGKKQPLRESEKEGELVFGKENWNKRWRCLTLKLKHVVSLLLKKEAQTATCFSLRSLRKSMG